MQPDEKQTGPSFLHLIHSVTSQQKALAETTKRGHKSHSRHYGDLHIWCLGLSKRPFFSIKYLLNTHSQGEMTLLH